MHTTNDHSDPPVACGAIGTPNDRGDRIVRAVAGVLAERGVRGGGALGLLAMAVGAGALAGRTEPPPAAHAALG